MSVNVKTAEYENYGKCLVISNGIIETYVTVDVGPRVIKAGLIGGTNVFWNDLNREMTKSGKLMDNTFYKGSAWNIYGGHRLWISPEHDCRSYYPDNDPVKYEITEKGAIFTPDPQKTVNVAHSIEIIMNDDCTLSIIHHVKNISSKAKTFAPWALSVLAPGGFEIIPQPQTDTGLLGNRVLALWPYSNMADNRVCWGKDYITLKQDTNIEIPFKFGINNEFGWGAYILDDLLFVKRYNHNPDGTYPDFGVSYETYTNKYFLEAETLGELADVASNETVSHTEIWEFIKVDDIPDPKDLSAVNEFVCKHIK